jgi:hypothetical protein
MTPTAVLLLPIAAAFIGLSIRDIARDAHGLRRRRSHRTHCPPRV